MSEDSLEANKGLDEFGQVTKVPEDSLEANEGLDEFG